MPRNAQRVSQPRKRFLLRSPACIVALASLLPSADSSAAQPLSATSQLQVNSYTGGDQSYPAIASDAAGNFVVVWQSVFSSGTDGFFSIQARRFSVGGSPLGTESEVNGYTTGIQEWPDVASGPEGDFVVVWQSAGSFGSDTSDFSIQAQRFDANGVAQGAQIQVNSYTANGQFNPDVAVDPQGEFVVVWSSYGSSGSDSYYSIVGQRLDAFGTPVGPEFQVNSYTTSFQFSAAIAADGAGNFVVVWESYGSSGTDTAYTSIQAQRYDADGTPVGGEFQVNSYTTSWQSWPEVAASDQGDFLIVWQSRGSSGSDSSETSIQAQRYDPSGTPLGGQFQVNSYTTSYQRRPAVAADSVGGFLVVWSSEGSDGSDPNSSIEAQYFDATGAALGPQFQVNAYTTRGQSLPAVTTNSSGDFIVAWESQGSSGTDTSGYSIQARRYCGLFCDGFEGGDASGWSAVVP